MKVWKQAVGKSGEALKIFCKKIRLYDHTKKNQKYEEKNVLSTIIPFVGICMPKKKIFFWFILCFKSRQVIRENL